MSFDSSWVSGLHVTVDADAVAHLFRALDLPRVTPAFVKWNNHDDCEPGELGRCFCDESHRCTVGRNDEAGERDDRSEDDEDSGSDKEGKDDEESGSDEAGDGTDDTLQRAEAVGKQGEAEEGKPRKKQKRA